MPVRLTFVLVPGAWHGGWAWNPVARHLREAGHDAVSLTLPGLSVGDDPRGLRLADATAHIVEQIRWASTSVARRSSRSARSEAPDCSVQGSATARAGGRRAS